MVARRVGGVDATTLPDLLDRLMATDPSRPLVTFYDDATGERVELSATSFDNWVAKTANLLQDELGAEPGEQIALLLPTHWQSAVWVWAAAACGLVITHDHTLGRDAAVVVCPHHGEPHAGRYQDDGDQREQRLALLVADRRVVQGT